MQIAATTDATCSTAHGDSILDYWILGGGAQQYAFAVALDPAVAVKPQTAVSLTLRSLGGRIPVGEVWRRPGKGNATQVIGPHWDQAIDWAHFDRTVADLHTITNNTSPEVLCHTGANEKLDKALDDTWNSFQTSYFSQAQSRFGSQP
jgi:hypothetical protein